MAAALTLPPQAKPIPVAEAAAWLSIGAAADLWSTGYGLRRDNLRELNGWGQNTDERVALQLAFVAAGSLAINHVSKTRPRRAQWLLRGMVAAKLVAAGLNLRTALKDR